MKRKLFISQPMSGCDDKIIKEQRATLFSVFKKYIGTDDVELIEQHLPDDDYDTDGNFESNSAREFYRFSRSIGMMGKATNIILYGEWEHSRGCKLEKEILDQYKIDYIDQRTLIAFCIKNNLITELVHLWPREAATLREALQIELDGSLSPKDDNDPEEAEIKKVLDGAYPLCVIKDRYGGTYSGGEYTAWVCGISYIPDGIFEDDVSCASTWSKLKAARKKGEASFGLGETPEEALRDLAKTMIRNSKIQNEEENE